MYIYKFNITYYFYVNKYLKIKDENIHIHIKLRMNIYIMI